MKTTLLKKKHQDKNVGYGVFANTEFKQNDFLCYYVGIAAPIGKTFFSKRQWCDGDPFYQVKLDSKTLMYTPKAMRRLITSPGQFGCFINHSSTPNCELASWSPQIGMPPIIIVRATKKIAVGDELLVDYGPDWFEDNGIDPNSFKKL